MWTRFASRRKTIGGLYDGATTRELDTISIDTAASLIAEEPQYSRLAARLLLGTIVKEIASHNLYSFSQAIAYGSQEGVVNPATAEFVQTHARKLNHAIDDSLSDRFEYFGLRTVYDRYLLRDPISRTVIESPQYFFLRVACGLAGNPHEAIEFYRLIASLDYMPSSPTLFNSGTKHAQMSSCYLHDSPSDSLESIYDSYKRCRDALEVLWWDWSRFPSRPIRGLVDSCDQWAVEWNCSLAADAR